MKNFTEDFYKLLSLLKNGEPFAFTRFSDGELFILQNRKISVEENQVYLREGYHQGYWGKEEHKVFIPEDHSFFRDKLIECFRYTSSNFYKGICCSEDVGRIDFESQFEFIDDSPEHNLTWANLLINANYPRFIEEMVPEFKNKKIIYICNSEAKIENLPFSIFKDFRVGSNCHIDNYSLVEEIKKWGLQESIKDSVFLFSCGTLSNFIIPTLHESMDDNTYIDIGSTLNPILGLTGWVGSRHYLLEYWGNKPREYLNMVGVWG
tara:strand:- start:15218 stop:16009 length:792 start_codon:yes stop_codon:yes gene_type:complete